MQCNAVLCNIAVLNLKALIAHCYTHFHSQAPTSASLALCIGHLRHHINGILISEFFIIDQPTFMFTENPTPRMNNNACICASYFCICTFFVSTFAFARSTFLLFQAGANKDERDVPEMQNSTMFWDSKLFRMKTVNIAHHGQKEKNMILDSKNFLD